MFLRSSIHFYILQGIAVDIRWNEAENKNIQKNLLFETRFDWLNKALVKNFPLRLFVGLINIIFCLH